MNLISELARKKLITPPKFLADTVQLLVISGSHAYGVDSKGSDWDLYGFAIPPKEVVFPHLAGYIPGFGSQPKKFEQFQAHHIHDSEAADGVNPDCDMVVYSIVKFFQLCMGNNPNMVDSLFVPDRCVLFATDIGRHVRDNRHIFLHKGCWHTFKGYAHSQLSKMENKNPIGKRKKIVEQI